MVYDLIVRSLTHPHFKYTDLVYSAASVLTAIQVPAHVSVDDTAACVGQKKEMDFQGFDVKVICMACCMYCCSSSARFLCIVRHFELR